MLTLIFLLQCWLAIASARSQQTTLSLDTFNSVQSFLSQYQLRVTSVSSNLCDPSVQQYSGYLDISDQKHLFFWFFESRSSPETAPLTLWLNGGPGGSSMLGLLAELGPCNIADEGKNTTFNKYSWNSVSNMIFLDQPANVGNSYSDGGTQVDNSQVAAADVYAFLQLFLEQFPKYDSAPFHVAAESYGGIYGPNIASTIHRRNKARQEHDSPWRNLRHINLTSLILANGMTDPYIQFAAIVDYVCDGPYAILRKDSSRCKSLRSKVPTCQRLIQACYDFDSRLTCLPATTFCWENFLEPLMNLPINPYDVRKGCNRSEEHDGPYCYREQSWVEKWMNLPAIRKAIGADSGRPFTLINQTVHEAFMSTGDSTRNTSALIPELINDGVRLLVYTGVTDLTCNYMGNEAWLSNLQHKYHEAFKRSVTRWWVTIDQKIVAGKVRSAGGNDERAGDVAFVQVLNAGHMVPFDKPLEALDMFSRWINDAPLTSPEFSWPAGDGL